MKVGQNTSLGSVTSFWHKCGEVTFLLWWILAVLIGKTCWNIAMISVHFSWYLHYFEGIHYPSLVIIFWLAKDALNILFDVSVMFWYKTFIPNISSFTFVFIKHSFSLTMIYLNLWVHAVLKLKQSPEHLVHNKIILVHTG